MEPILTADLDALRSLADKQRRSAATLRDIDLHSVLREAHRALDGSQTAEQCGRAGAAAESAIAVVAARVESLSEANRRAADTLGVADSDHASAIRALTNAA
ncbi:hypothetical protein [Williamsia maris]|uniref:Uncharacterized protein n=1 Tax=Williamsia maris TaxID=72806 RepID=A0ABT1HJS8_9NOCA|nr:hypothetical protein [Williamsia maris]MCP2178177.1 hypothetical protein [Williamsia maris]